MRTRVTVCSEQMTELPTVALLGGQSTCGKEGREGRRVGGSVDRGWQEPL